MLTLNARSVKNKADQVAELILEKDIDVCAITETWLSGSERDSVIRGTLCPDGYKLLDAPRANHRGGGVPLICKQSLTIKQQKVASASSYRSTYHCGK